jgi:rubredoxin
MLKITIGGIDMKYVCSICGYVYDPAIGDPERGIAPGTPWEKVDEDFACPICSADKSAFNEE